MTRDAYADIIPNPNLQQTHTHKLHVPMHELKVIKCVANGVFVSNRDNQAPIRSIRRRTDGSRGKLNVFCMILHRNHWT